MPDKIVTPPYESHIIEAMRGRGVQRAYAVRDRLVEIGNDFGKRTPSITYRLKKMEEQGLVRCVGKDGRGFEWALDSKVYFAVA